MLNYQYEILVVSYINQCSNNSINSHDKRACIMHKMAILCISAKRKFSALYISKTGDEVRIGVIRLTEMEVHENHRRKCMLQCLPLITISSNCRCHIVRHQHRDDNVVKTTLSATTLRHRVQNVVEVNVPLIILRWIEYWIEPLLTTYYIHISWDSRKTWYSNYRICNYSQIRYKNIMWLLIDLINVNYWKYV